MPRLLYTLIYILLLPAIVIRLLWRSIRAPGYAQRVAERFGFFVAPDFQEKALWVHAVSLGESIAAGPMILELLALYPQMPIVVTTMTPTGSARVQALFGRHERVFHVYAPYDLPFFVNRFLKQLRPRLLIVMETELWPNIIHCCKSRDIPVLLANARLSEKSARGYARIAPLTRGMLNELSTVVAQTEAEGQRFLGLGLAPQRLVCSGSIKFDISVDERMREQAAALKAQWSAQGRRLILMAASTHPGEHEIVLDAYRGLKASVEGLLLILVPRHPEQFDAALKLCQAGDFKVAQRSRADTVEDDTDVLLGDTLGEMMLLYGTADMVYMGGTLIEHGGHNFLEPAAWQLPLISGASVYNFTLIAQLLKDAGALKWVADVSELTAALLQLCEDESKRLQQGQRALQVVDENRGALQRLLDEIDKFL